MRFLILGGVDGRTLGDGKPYMPPAQHADKTAKHDWAAAAAVEGSGIACLHDGRRVPRSSSPSCE
jgi:hypothetical protein